MPKKFLMVEDSGCKQYLPCMMVKIFVSDETYIQTEHVMKYIKNINFGFLVLFWLLPVQNAALHRKQVIMR